MPFAAASIEGIPILDYTPETLVGVTILALIFGWLVPYRAVKLKDEEIAVLRSTNAKLVDSLSEHDETLKVYRRLFGSLETGAR